MLTLVKDLGMEYPTPKARQRTRMGMYLCSGCNKEHKFRKPQIKAGFTNWCKECGMKYKNKEK